MWRYFLLVGLGFLLNFCTMQPKVMVKCAVNKGKNYPIYYYYSHSKCVEIEKILKGE